MLRHLALNFKADQLLCGEVLLYFTPQSSGLSYSKAGFQGKSLIP